MGPICASLIAIDGAPPLATLFADLQRELLDVSMEKVDHLDAGPDPDRSVVLLWVPSGLPAGFYERVVQWADDTEPRAGLLGCAREGTSADSERALAAGFDDYVAGQCSSRELAARMRAVFRRMHWPAARRTERIRYGALELDPGEHEVWHDGRAVTLTAIEMAVLRALLEAGGKALRRTELLDRAWGEGNLDISERAVDNVVLRLRRKLDAPGLIRTVRGIGFRLDDRRDARDCNE